MPTLAFSYWCLYKLNSEMMAYDWLVLIQSELIFEMCSLEHFKTWTQVNSTLKSFAPWFKGIKHQTLNTLEKVITSHLHQ